MTAITRDFKMGRVSTSMIVLFFFFLCYLTLTYILIFGLLSMGYPVLFAPTLKLPNVVVHIDLKRTPLKMKYLNYLLPKLKEYGVNGLLMEYEDIFPFEGNIKSLGSSYRYRKDELTGFLSKAMKLNISIIPLVQTFGHMEYALKHRKFQHLRETPSQADSICPTLDESQVLIAEMLRQVIDLHTKIQPLKYIHVGFDEVYHIKECNRCKLLNASKQSMIFNHLKNVKRIVQTVSPTTTILIWDDMFRKIIPQAWVDRNALENVEVVCWEYGGQSTPMASIGHKNLYQYHKMFNNIWIASAYKGADGDTSTLPDFRKRFNNNLQWLKFISDYKFGGEDQIYTFKGIILTGWSRYNHFKQPCDLLPASLPSLMINLILIEGFRTNSRLLWKEDYFAELSIDFAKALGCPAYFILKDNNDDLNLFPCKFHGCKLFGALKRYQRFLNSVPQDLFNLTVRHEVDTGLSQDSFEHLVQVTIEKYKTKVNKIQAMVLETVEKYYSYNFAREYVDFKIKAANKTVDAAIYQMNHIPKKFKHLLRSINIKNDQDDIYYEYDCDDDYNEEVNRL